MSSDAGHIGGSDGPEPHDTSELHAALRRGTYGDFLAQYSPAIVHYDGFASGTLLEQAVGNSNLEARVQIAHRLLDDGADVRRGRPVHVLVGAANHDFEAEAPLLERMLDQGADVNQVVPKRGTPLEAVAAQFKFSDRDLTPFYDVLLTRPDIDFTTPGLGGRSVLVNLRTWYAKRAALVERVEALMTERGLPLPDPAS